MTIAEVPVKRYVGAYLRKQYGVPARLSFADHIGKFFFMLLEDQLRRKDKYFGGYDSMVEVVISEDMFYRYGYNLTETGIIYFNNFVESCLKSEAFTYLDGKTEDGMPIKDAIELWMVRMHFSESEWPLESLKKAYYRYRMRNEPTLIRLTG